MTKEQFEEAQVAVNNISFLASQLEGCQSVLKEVEKSEATIIPFSLHGFEARISDPRFYGGYLQLTKNEVLEVLKMRSNNIEEEIKGLENKFAEI